MTRWFLAFLSFLMAVSVNATQGLDFLEEAETLADGEWLVLVEGEDMLFVYRASHEETDRVHICCGIQRPLLRIEGESPLWYLRYHVPDIDEAVIGYSFQEFSGESALSWSPYQVWRGENAPEAPPRSFPLQGRIQTREFESEFLGESRQIMIYYPPNYEPTENYPVIYLADGQSTENAAYFVERLILDEAIAPMLLIGAFSGEYRAEEYLPGRDENRFEAHERFFTEELRLWAEDELGASSETSERAVYGHSNGGVFAATMALLHPELYGIAFPFSAGLNPFDVYPNNEIEPSLKLYFTAGTLETGFFSNTRELSRRFAEAGAETVFHGRVAGHDFILWQEELYHGVLWAFGD